jgi:hypothetical protein
MLTSSVKKNQPWASGPGEILQHGINLLQKDTDTNRRLAMLSIDNAVELTIKTYLGLPKRVTGLNIRRKDFDEFSESFPKLLDALEQHAGKKLEGIELSVIDWYHRLRNKLYHEGNGLTVEKDKVIVYAELAQLLFLRLFGFQIEIDKPSTPEIVGNFVTAWSNLYQVLESLAKARFPSREFRGTNSIIPELALKGLVDGKAVDEIRDIRKVRNEVVHGNIENLRPELTDRLKELTTELKKKLNINIQQELMLKP